MKIQAIPLNGNAKTPINVMVLDEGFAVCNLFPFVHMARKETVKLTLTKAEREREIMIHEEIFFSK